MTTVASGRCTSAPEPLDTAMGMNPRFATKAVMSTGRSLVIAPCQTASLIDLPLFRRPLMYETMTRPLRTATPIAQ